MASSKPKTPAPTQQEQFTLNFEPGLTERHRNLRDCVTSGVYRRGLSTVAIELNKAPGNLSAELADDTNRHFSVDSLETYIEKSGDVTPIHYLIEKFLKHQTDLQAQAIAQLAPVLAQLGPILRQAGIHV